MAMIGTATLWIFGLQERKRSSIGRPSPACSPATNRRRRSGRGGMSWQTGSSGVDGRPSRFDHAPQGTAELGWGFEPAHDLLVLSYRPVRALGAVVQSLVRPVIGARWQAPIGLM